MALAALLLVAGNVFAAGRKNEFRYKVGPAATLSITNRFGPITVQPAAGDEVVIVATASSDKVEADSSQNGSRIEVRTRFLGAGNDAEGSVEYQAQVPPGATVIIRSATGSVQIQGLRGDISAQCESGQITITDLKNAHLQVRTVGAPVTLSNLSNTYLDVTSVGGAIRLTNVSGPRVSVSTSSGSIRYTGDFGGNGTYSLATHSGDMEVLAPAAASLDLSARSLRGSVNCDLPLQPKPRSTIPPSGQAIVGQANSGASSVRLSSFTGNITVKKQ